MLFESFGRARVWIPLVAFGCRLYSVFRVVGHWYEGTGVHVLYVIKELLHTIKSFPRNLLLCAFVLDC
jgi:hypothetical protein